MLTLVQKSAVYERVDHFMNIANDEYHHNISGAHVRFDKRGTCGGTADHEMMELNFNASLMLDNWDEYMNQIIPHEVAHLVKAAVFGTSRKGSMMSSHGGYWRQVMRVFGINPDRCHAMDTTKVAMPKAKHIYICDKCQKELVISSVRHNKMVRGTKKYSHCRGHGLTHKKALGKMTNSEAMDHKTPAFMQQEATMTSYTGKKIPVGMKPARKSAPKQGTKIAHAMTIYNAMVVDGVRSSRQDTISALANSMQISKHQAAGYYQNCKKKAA